MSQPERGARFLFELAEANEEEARYALTIFTPEGELRGEARLTLTGGEVRLALEPPEEGAAQLAEARALAKTLLTHRRGDEDGRWKRRLMRWRD